MKLEDIKAKVDKLIMFGQEVLETRKSLNEWQQYVSDEEFNTFRSSSLSFLKIVFGIDHPFYTEFKIQSKSPTPIDTKNGLGVLKAAKLEIEEGWLLTVKEFISADIFSNFLEMAEYLLNEDYKDASAVMIGGVLEEHLRQLCIRNSISIEVIEKGKTVPKKAELMNSELSSNSIQIYSKLDQKNVTAWLHLRNNAAHGEYSKYTKEQVEIMYQGVTNFITRTTNTKISL